MERATVYQNEALNENVFLLSLEVSSKTLHSFRPGQFLKIKVPDSRLDPLFPRPFTVHALEEDRLLVLYQVVGKGTKALSEVRVGSLLEFLGPLGKPFPQELDFPLALCAGGVGVAGFGFLLQSFSLELRQKTFLYYGARSAKDLVRLSFFEGLSKEVKVATEDGSMGAKGFVTELLEEDLKRREIRSLLACGPKGMLKRVKELSAKYGVKTYLTLETFLACGTGFCKGCVIPCQGGGYLHLCEEGPTLSAEEVEI